MMYKGTVLGSLVLVLVMGLIAGFYILPGFAQEGETITITTYYPSPYGVYNEFQSNKMAVGDTNEDGQLTAADQPPADGQLYTARSVIYKPQSSLPAFDTREGELVYSETDKKFYYYDGSSWVAQAGGGGCYVSYSGGCLNGFTNMGSAGWWGSCSRDPSLSAHFRPPGGGCYSGWSYHTLGRAYVCCR